MLQDGLPVKLQDVDTKFKHDIFVRIDLNIHTSQTIYLQSIFSVVDTVCCNSCLCTIFVLVHHKVFYVAPSLYIFFLLEEEEEEEKENDPDCIQFRCLSTPVSGLACCGRHQLLATR